MDEENKQSEEKPSMSAKKKMRIAGGVYIALAICVVTVMILSIYSVSNTPIKLPEVSIPEISVPDNSNSKSPKPVINEQSNIAIDTSEPENETPVFTLPVNGEIEKGYHMTSLVFSETMKDYRVHSGVDISGKIGDAVKCYTDGVVSAVTDDPFMGKTVEITHDYGLVSVYQNLAYELPENVYVGAEVKSGDTIGAIGETAIAESADKPHLHFELRLNGQQINAEEEIKE